MQVTNYNNSAYSMDNAVRYKWGSISSELTSQRVALLKRYVVGRKVLDAGCGGGAYVNLLSQQGYDVVGVDKFDFFLDNARQKDWMGRFIQADLQERLPFEENTFETTYCMDVFEHIDDKTTIKELARVTSRRLILTVPREDVWFRETGLVLYPYQDPTHLRYYTPESLYRLAESIEPKTIQIKEQELIDMKKLVRKMFSPMSNKPGLERLYSWLFSFLLDRSEDPGVHLNLLAIIDL